ncbi:polysaccharide deacetylase family protein [[Clostridium] polysaccharolyticum]|jgi:peptidoglycan/xylan/chitin deacetylase (PgdA/CDA1 family)|uniref:Peptidoglycan/xylan/chitin deacetylase, PgdA/CDA1 family n=1 Tax=[Clostridium] polysaccharolyticum TaxID=29364 RepID=A0A1I0DY40_9FIRM|nr:polysaccharide deacetylase family protein [[Clostridium] polysaccharolyticum]SET37351.1 Peptidoglycan/xylan/chitin deacetylase, PgdA/CDA1 family [[Clostridium] polysaccharolyticum]
MSKKLVVAVFFVLALFICYRVEQKVYETKTYSYYKKLDAQNGGITEVGSEQVLEKEAASENLIVNQKKKVAYLTFDDGPSEITKDVLKILEEKGVNATFFLIGNQITEDTIPIVKQSIKDGNCIGIHTYCHECKVIYRSTDAYLEDFKKAYDTIKEKLQIEPKIFRFPWGSANKFLADIEEEVIQKLESEGFEYFDWNVSAEDSVGRPSSYTIMNNIRRDYKKYNKPVILMHDSSINKLSAQTLPQVIEELKQAGYTFDTLDHMDTPYQYPRD